MTKYISHMLVLIAAAVAAGCTVSNIEAPPLAGPSGLSLSLAITANPDVLSLDGTSQTLITVEARDHNGQPAANVPLRVEIVADGQTVDFGTISARTLVTNSSGRASFTYTAPTFLSGAIPDLRLSVTPTGTDASNHIERFVSVRLVPPSSFGVNPFAAFTFTPTTPAAFTNVRFDGSTSTAGLGAVITSYSWDFGDGTTGTGVTPTHQFSAVGNYLVRLTVTDSNGRTNQSAAQTVTVTAGEPPTATFVFSPTTPKAGDTVFFNATQSTAGTGHRIVRYQWNWGDGKPSSSGATASHVFTNSGTYVIVLTVTDEVGQVGTINTEVTIS
jgi:PKD repeat protein